MKTKVLPLIKGLLTAYAFLTVFHEPLSAIHYETTIDYLIASVYELLGNYDFRIILIGIVCGAFYAYLGKKDFAAKNSHPVLAGLFSAFLLIGNSYYENGSWGYCFGSMVNFLKFAGAFAGYSFLLHGLMQWLGDFLDKGRFVSEKPHFLSKRAFLKAFLILIVAYMPFLLLSYPGNLCWDAIGQIEQVIFETGYSSHHPLVHTLILGGIVQLGQILFHSYEIGVFMYMLLQLAVFAAALAATVWLLAKRGVNGTVLKCLLGLYAIAPIYSNMASTVLKDVPFVSFVIGYVICLSLLIEKPDRLHHKGFVAVFILLQLGVILLRNNGIYVVCIGGIIITAYLWKGYSIKNRLGSIAVLFAVSALVSKIVLAILMQVLNATPGSTGEMLSIPFQQTARYLQLYRTELTAKEREAIEAVLGDVDTVAAKYDPDISDPVKALFDKEASATELLAYFKTWFVCFFKHPCVYLEAFFQHVYGWFHPGITNAIRYETQYDVISQEGLFPQASKLVLFYYRFANRFTPLGILENVGIYVWGLIYITVYNWKRKAVSMNMMTVPLWISLLICMASPCFFLHPRYAFPIMFTLPFLICFMMSSKRRENDAKCI